MVFPTEGKVDDFISPVNVYAKAMVIKECVLCGLEKDAILNRVNLGVA